VFASIFLDFNLPNAATWFYFSLLLAVALFFKFNRLLSVRNWDVLTLFLLVPGLLLVLEGHDLKRDAQALEPPAAVLAGLPVAAGPPAGGLLGGLGRQHAAEAGRLIGWGYLWLLAGSAYFFVRCLIDLALVRRPTLAPNLNLAGLAWLAGALSVCLAAVAVRRAAPEEGPVGKPSPALEEAQRRAADFVRETTGEANGAATRFWVERGLAGACHLAVVAALILIGARHFGDLSAGMAAATLYLLLPYISFHVGQVHHVLPAALIVWAVAAYRWPVLAGLLLGLAAGTFFFPALVVPVWASFYWRRGERRFTAAFLTAAVLSLALTALFLWSDGHLSSVLPAVPRSLDWRFWRVPDAEGFWTGVHWAYRIPVCIVYVAFVLTTGFWPLPKDLAHLLALSAACLIGLQFWYADRGGVYVLWYLPLLLLVVFRPNLTDRQPPELARGTGRLARAWQTVRDWAGRLRPQPMARMQ
jgi:hypothetical protein